MALETLKRFLAKLSLRPPEKTLDLGIPASSPASPFVKALGGLSLLVRRSSFAGRLDHRDARLNSFDPRIYV
jgi:hypothetical protein